MKTNLSDHDYADRVVPEEGRRAALSVLMVWMGFIIVVGVMTIGGSLAGSVTEEQFWVSLLVGNLVLSIFAFGAGVTGSISGKSFNLLLRDTVSERSGRIMSAYVPVVLIGWYAIEVSIFGDLVSTALHIPGIGSRVVILMSSAIFALFAYFGFRLISYSALILVPTIVLVGAWSLLQIRHTGNLHFGFEAAHISTLQGISVVVGTWVMGSITCMQDFSRFIRSPRIAGVVSALGIFIANLFCLLIGAVGAATTRQADPAQILLSLGFLAPAILFSVASVWTTNDDNIYSASLNAATLFGVSRKTAVLICTLTGALLAVFEPYRSAFLFAFLGFLGTTAPPLGAIVLLRFWCFRAGEVGRSSIAAWLGWASGIAAGHFIFPELSFVTSLIAGGAVYIIVMRLLGKPRRFES